MCEKSKISLTDDELVLRAANGDDAAMALLIATVTPIARAKASGFASPRVSGDDLVQEGMLGFLDALKTYDASKGSPFKAYAEVCINNRIVSAVRTSFNNKNAALSNALSYESAKVDEADSGADPANIVSEKEDSEHIRDMLSKGLSDFEKQVVDLRLMDMSYSQISQRLCCSEKAVDNALQRIRKKMRVLFSL